MEFEHEKHPRTQITLLRASEELIETLEDNQVVTFESLKLVCYHFVQQILWYLCSNLHGTFLVHIGTTAEYADI